MLRPAYPRSDSHLELLVGRFGLSPVQTGYGSAQVFLDTFAQELLIAVELVAYIVKSASVTVVAVLCNGENLIIGLDGEVQPLGQVATNGLKRIVQVSLVVSEERYIVGILCGIERVGLADLDVQPFIDPMHEVREHEVGEVLRKVVAYR